MEEGDKGGGEEGRVKEGDKGGGGEGDNVTAVVRDEGRKRPHSSLSSPDSPSETLPPAISVGKASGGVRIPALHDSLPSLWPHPPQVQAGRLNGYGSHSLELVFSPEGVGPSTHQFIVSFSLPGVPPVSTHTHMNLCLSPA